MLSSLQFIFVWIDPSLWRGDWCMDKNCPIQKQLATIALLYKTAACTQTKVVCVPCGKDMN